ncbi:MAG TPA: extracellular solute-binding protein [Solirubrobacterales bacterium]
MAALLSLGLLIGGCGGEEDTAGGADGDGIDLVTYSALESVYGEALEPAFQETFLEEVGFENSFGVSAEQSQAVAEGAPASIVHFEQAGDMERLVDEGKVDPSWDERPYNGIAYNTVVVFVVRKGNPLQIQSLDDILGGKVDVVTPNPLGSDAGRWNVMAAYGTLIEEGKSEAEALAGVKALLEQAVAQPSSATDALAAFLQGEGDVLIAYESDAIRAVEEAKGVHFVVPHETILVQTPIAVTAEAPKPAAEDFLEFLWSEDGQLIWAENGYRPVNRLLVNQERFFPREAFRIDRFGGWAKVNDEFFDPETGSIAEIERELGVPASE